MKFSRLFVLLCFVVIVVLTFLVVWQQIRIHDLGEATGQILSLRQNVADNEETIKSLQQQNGALVSQNQTLQEKVNSLTDQNQSLSAEIDRLQAAVARQPGGNWYTYIRPGWTPDQSGYPAPTMINLKSNGKDLHGIETFQGFAADDFIVMVGKQKIYVNTSARLVVFMSEQPVTYTGLRIEGDAGLRTLFLGWDTKEEAGALSLRAGSLLASVQRESDKPK